MKKFENKVVIITGAGAGMGKAMVSLFAQEGGKIVAADISQERLDHLAKEMLDAGFPITTVLANMAIESEIDHMVDVAINTYGTIDVLINNAGIMDHFAPAGEVDNDTWDRVMSVNLDGPFKAMRKALSIFLPKNSGNIINICSIGGIKGGVAGAAYTTSKHGLIGLTKNTGYMYGKTGIRCNAIAPGAVNTSIAETIDYSKITPLVQDRIMSGLVLNPRTGNPEEIARLALFLASDDASFITGAVYVADGGWSAY
ncbi:MAG: SDR family oxidoreductase [Saprospiraceae bacterium]|jgi:NAD(P)-dependent dehydrogenase (short-subunit alcohol dehydrogenase family)|nr:SDR family oxidoreductase [Saprospiraceae bacterium]